MERQNDWYTGIDYYHNYLEKEISVEELRVEGEGKLSVHGQVELYFIRAGLGELEVNGCRYQAEEGALFCLYPHHFYRMAQVWHPIEAVVVRFHIGLFMYMSWEKHPQNANAKLVYDSKPVVYLTGADKGRIEALVADLVAEQNSGRFESRNLLLYQTLELHAYYCRYAFESIGPKNEAEPAGVWGLISQVLLASSRPMYLQSAAEAMGCAPDTLNRRVKEASGYTFHQLVQMGKLLNACALLHFPELTVDYISDLLGFSTKQNFYRMFEQYLHMTPRQYQERRLGHTPGRQQAEHMALRVLQYIHLHFHEEIDREKLSEVFCLKTHTVKQMVERCFGMGLPQLLGQIRVCYACSFLRTGNLTVLEISSLCGFESVSSFQRVFSHWMRQSPGEYRRSFPIFGSRNENKNT